MYIYVVTSTTATTIRFLKEHGLLFNCRYVSAPEAMWRLLQSPMHERSHSVMRLPVHLPNQQLIFFEPGREEEALEAARSRRTKLEAWFSLNATDADAQQLHYTGIT